MLSLKYSADMQVRLICGSILAVGMNVRMCYCVSYERLSGS